MDAPNLRPGERIRREGAVTLLERACPYCGTWNLAGVVGSRQLERGGTATRPGQWYCGPTCNTLASRRRARGLPERRGTKRPDAMKSPEAAQAASDADRPAQAILEGRGESPQDGAPPTRSG